MVSIHAPTRGATLSNKACIVELTEFQSTHPHGVRQILENIKDEIIEVSIHAPTRGATLSNYTIVLVLAFQSTHPHGVRLENTYLSKKDDLFQSTHPHGVRQVVDPPHWRALSFNPRTHTGCDNRACGNQAVFSVSIHAPTRGATQSTTVKSKRT